jgi:hypothetical protein
MKDYEVEVKVQVKVTAYDENDAKELIDDTFGPGEDCGVTIVNTAVTKLKEV